MPKRFIDTELFNDSWFMSLSKDAKLLWIYLITRCNHAGIIEINEPLLKFQTGIKSYLTVSEELANRLITVKKGYVFIPKFIEFQYPNFPNSNVRQQQSAIKILEEFNLFNDGILTVSKELTNPYEHDNGNVSVSVIEIKNKEIVFISNLEQFKDKYPVEMFKEFFEYWTEPNKSGTKLRWELEKTWDISRRLSRWANNNKQFKKNGGYGATEFQKWKDAIPDRKTAEQAN